MQQSSTECLGGGIGTSILKELQQCMRRGEVEVESVQKELKEMKQHQQMCHIIVQ